MVRACTVCGLPIPEGARYCPNCGAAAGSLVETEERKMVTVLFADIVDSTGLAQRFDAERSRELLGRFFDAASDELTALRGRPEKFIGDAVMAVFGLPHVHEDDALRAVRAGLAIRERVRRLGGELGLDLPLQVRIGIESGEAAVGSSPTGQLLVTGTVVNAAARLQAAAQPGQVLVGQTTQLLTATNVAYGRRRRIRAKGFNSPLEAFPVDEITARSARRTIPFVGRASEQAILGQSLGLASTTGRPVLVTIIGEPGIGKSRLADELAAGVSAAVMIVFEDTHTLKAPMLDLIERTATRAQSSRRALVIALARNELLEQRPTWGSTTSNSVLIRLDALSRDESVQLARHAGGGRIGDVEALEIAERAGGNPYFIIETTGMLMPSSAGADGQGSRTVPPTVQAVVSARLDALPQRLRELARRASVVKYAFDLTELGVVDPEASAEELQQLEDAEMIVRDPQPGEPELWRLRHSTLKEVIYASLAKRERLRLHELVARFLLDGGHPSLAADHLELAAFASIDLDPNDRTVPDRAADALLVAGDRARRRMESRSAIDRYQRALALAGPEPRWNVREARILAGMGEAHYWLAEYPAATQALTRAVTLGEAHQDPFALALALRFLGDIAINFEADVDKAERLLSRSLLAAEQLGDSWAIVRSLLFAGWVPWTRERFEEADAIWRRALDLVDPNDHWARVRALTALSINRGEMHDLAAALQLIDEASALAEEAGDRFSVANTSVQKGRVLDDLGRAAEALPWFDRGVSICGELGARWEMADARAARGIAKRNLGRLDEAEEDLRFAIRVAEELGDRQLPAWTWRNLAQVAELRGDKAAAEELLQRSKDAESRGPH